MSPATLFALLTGFLLSGPFLRARLENRPGPKARQFLRARVARIYPAYWVALVGAALTIGLPGHGAGGPMASDHTDSDVRARHSVRGTTPRLVPVAVPELLLRSSPLVLVATPDRVLGTRRGIDLAVRGWMAAPGGGPVSWVTRTTSMTDPIAREPYYTLLGRADWFATRHDARRPHNGAGPGGGSAAPATSRPAAGNGTDRGARPDCGERPVPVHWEELRDQLDAAAGAVLISGAVLVGPALRGPQRWLASRPARALGRWSYGIFLWGYIVQKLITKIEPGVPTAAHLALTMAGAVALGAASWRYIDKPLVRHLAGRRRDTKQPTHRRATPSLPARRSAPAHQAPDRGYELGRLLALLVLTGLDDAVVGVVVHQTRLVLPPLETLSHSKKIACLWPSRTARSTESI